MTKLLAAASLLAAVSLPWRPHTPAQQPATLHTLLISPAVDGRCLPAANNVPLYAGPGHYFRSDVLECIYSS